MVYGSLGLSGTRRGGAGGRHPGSPHQGSPDEEGQGKPGGRG